ncbi:MAG: amidohydrolase family protein, partial [Armatimonadota bacterium]
RATISEELVGRRRPGRYGGGFHAVLIAGVRSDRNRWTEGKRLTEVAEEWGTDPVSAMIRLLLDEEMSVSMCNFVLCEEDVETVMRHARVCVGSDASARSPDGPLGIGKPHPRSYGTFPRVLGRYVRERGVIPLEEAVRKMTHLPATILRLDRRGMVSTGSYADLVVFDPAQVSDTATYDNPHQTARGIRWVVVNGVVAAEDGRPTGALPGRVLRLRPDGRVD